jgi:hypothetical protein
MRVAAIAAAVALLGPARAPAVDLTGVWTSAKEARCTRFDSSGATSLSATLDMDVDQAGPDLLVNVPDGPPFDGLVFSDSKKDVGRGHFSPCGPLPPPAEYMLLLVRSAKTFPEKRSGVSGRMTLEWLRSGPGFVLVCKKLVLERTSTDPGLLTICP